jgi:hypothetical protein
MILAAARFGDIDTLEDCINKGAEVNCQDHNVSNIVYRTHIKIINIKIVYLYKVKSIKYIYVGTCMFKMIMMQVKYTSERES